MAKSLQSAVNQGVEVYNTVQQYRSNVNSSNNFELPIHKVYYEIHITKINLFQFEKASTLALDSLESGEYFNFCTDKTKNIYYVVTKREDLIVFKSENNKICKEILNCFNNLVPLYRETGL